MMVHGWLRPAFHAVAFLTYSFLLIPILVVLIASLTSADFVSFPPKGMSFRWYSALVRNEDFMHSALVSLVLATLTALGATILAVPAAIALVRYRFPGREILSALFLSPLMLPSVVIGIALLQFASRLGVLGNPVVLWLGHLLIATPYCLRLLMASLTGFDRNLELAALNLGASRVQAFYRVMLPLIAPGAAAGAAFAFVVSFDDLVVSMFLASPTLMPLPVRIYNFIDQSSSPLITAVGSLLVLFAIVIVFLIDRIFGVERAFRMSHVR
jgi:putative spermidine/putrescine transport system permease protein